MLSPRYSILVARPGRGVIRRLRVSGPGLWFAAAALLAVPVLLGLAMVAAVQAELVSLRNTNAILAVENAAFRAAAGELAGQITSIQGAIDEISDRAELDPDTRAAINRLPAVVRSRAIGGPTTPGGRAAPLPERTLGLLRELLGALENRLAAVRTTVENQRALAAATPTIWPAAGWLSSAFGTRADPFSGSPDFHAGLDISAHRGTAVFATADGVVRAARYTGDYGNAVLLDHGFGIETRFAHLSRFAVRVGQPVRRGDVIGFVGSTGRSTSAHLHYEVWLNNRLVNPLRLLSTR
jgi:murein DD-endopeptidase MepM/ murein hydrolase activator NlpD